eukprot:TRINITY_DN486_c0_g1_i1.p1 TRINITY_DN486_c0_g1~~TRINITY_DN486_c0_g1_i1.p1  ORF type:complete len:279 (+),score=70.79 TRINITY_DN486_c0_g1_i1:212-1048(+)
MNIRAVLVGLVLILGVIRAQELYVTFHGGSESGVNNIEAYSLTGTHLKSVVTNPSGLDELRGMAIFNNNLYFANAYKEASFVGQVPVCGGSYSKAFTTNLQHPYGVAASSNSLYVSNQDNNLITQYSPGATNKVFATSSKSPRGVAVAPNGNVIFSDEKSDKVEIYSVNGYKVNEIKIEKPIGLYVDSNSNTLYVGSNGKNTKQVVAYSLSGYSQVGTYTHSSMGHPAGITSYNGQLYVLDQDNTSLIYFSVASQTYLGTLARNLPDKPEQLLLVKGC